MGKTKKIIDISTYQSNVNWKKVKADGISGVIVRAGYGTTEDKKFKDHIKGATAVGLPVGIYWFSYAYTVEMAKKEAQKCIQLIKSYKIQLPVYYDWEYDSMRYAKQHGANPSRKLITNMNIVFCEALKKAGYKAGVYYNYDYKMNHLDMDSLKKYSLWYALYRAEKTTGCDLQQYTSGGSVSGISGKVDMNYLLNEKLLATQPKKETKKEEPKKETKKTTKVKIVYPHLPVRGYFKNGDKGKQVQVLQTALNACKFNCGKIDGIYGAKTIDGVKKFQKAVGIMVDGKFGVKSLAALKKYK